MVFVRKNSMFLQVVSEVVADNMLEDFAGHRGQGHGSVVFGFVSVTLLENTGNIGCQPV
jgi:hypothetical protein